MSLNDAKRWFRTWVATPIFACWFLWLHYKWWRMNFHPLVSYMNRTEVSTGISWSTCVTLMGTPYECGHINVPLDYSNPKSNQNITVAVARIRCSDPASRIGSMMYLQGGPGIPSIPTIDLMPTRRLRRYFDIVTMDYRGVGKSTPIKYRTRRSGCDAAGWPTTDQEYEAVASCHRELARDLQKRSGDIVKHADTVSVAHDLEVFRSALGEEILNFFGASYGTHVATAYAELYPARIRTMAMDGVVDSTSTQMKLTMDKHVLFQMEFDRFAAWCDSSPFAGCAIHGRNVHQVVERALDLAGDDTTCFANYIMNLLEHRFYSAVADALAVASGESFMSFSLASLLSFPINPMEWTFPRPPWTYWLTSVSSMCRAIPGALYLVPAQSIRCLGVDPAAGQNATYFREQEPALDTIGSPSRHMGHVKGRSACCVGWPFANKFAPHRLDFSTGRQPPPILIANSLYDLRTPYSNAVNLHRQLPGSVLLTTRVKGHCSWTPYAPFGSEASRAIEDYLITGRLPPSDTIVDN